jgi:hypothetical protein
MKTIFWLMLMLLIGVASVSADPNFKGRYYYDSSDKLMIDTETGKAYGFVPLSSEIILTEIDYVNGNVKPVKSIRLDDKKTAEEFDRINQGDSVATWIQRMTGVLTSWRRVGQG